MSLLLDTHALLWWKAGGERLSRRAGREIARAERILVSPISFWETATLVRKRRIELDRQVHEWVADVLGDDAVELAPLSEQAATEAGLLPEGFAGDPADRLLYATALDLVVPLLSKDRVLHDLARERRDVRVLW